MITLDDFNKQIVMPMLLKQIESGALDSVIFDPDCKDIILNDPELLEAVNKRIVKLVELGS